MACNWVSWKIDELSLLDPVQCCYLSCRRSQAVSLGKVGNDEKSTDQGQDGVPSARAASMSLHSCSAPACRSVTSPTDKDTLLRSSWSTAGPWQRAGLARMAVVEWNVCVHL